MKKVILLALCAMLMGCASFHHNEDERAEVPAGSPSAKVISDVPFIEQSVGQCGPATLTMVMQWAGKPVSVNEIAAEVYTPGMKGSLQSDLVSASRRQGLMAIPIHGFSALLQEVSAGHPVIIFENLGLSWLQQWHYAVVLGYDLPKHELILHSGPKAFEREDIHVFASSWRLADFWGLVVLPPTELAASADEVSHLAAAAGLEQADKKDEATQAYHAILKRWSQSQGAFMGLGNIAFAKKELKTSIEFLTKATKAHPDVAAAWHNLAIAQGEAQLKKAAHQSAKRAVQLASPQEKTAYQENLKDFLSD